MFDSSDSVPNDPGWSPGDDGVPGDLDPSADSGDSGLSGWLESLPVGGAGLGELAAIDPDALDGAQRVDLLVAWSRQLAHAQAMQTRVVASMAIHDNEPVQVAGGTMRDPVAEEIGCALNISAFAGHLLVDVSRTLVTRLPNILNLVQAGTISWAVAKVMVEEIPATWSGPTDPAPAIEQAMLARVTDRTPAQVRRSAKRVVNRICPADAARRAKTAARGRGVSLFSQPDAMMTVCALLPAADAQYVYTTIDRAARRRVAELKAAAATAAGEPIDVPGIDATRADIFLELATRLATDEAGEGTDTGNGARDASNTNSAGGGTVRSGPKRTVAVVIDALTALGLADNPGHLPGYGPIPAAVARELAADATWVRWITDPLTGALLDAGRLKYRPSTALRSFLIARDVYCRFPGCQAQGTGATTEIDHAQPFNHTDPAAGGLTTRENLGALCKKHHQYKSGGLWSITTSNPDGSCEWTSPTGRRYYSSPNDILTNDFNATHDDQTSPGHPADNRWPDVLAEPPEPEPDYPDSQGPDPWLPHQEPTELERKLAHALCA